jgi:hypothetical protein
MSDGVVYLAVNISKSYILIGLIFLQLEFKILGEDTDAGFGVPQAYIRWCRMSMASNCSVEWLFIASIG